MSSQWKKSVDLAGPWEWRGDKLWHSAADTAPAQRRRVTGLHTRFVDFVYADQNRSRSVRKALLGLLDQLDDSKIALNIGAGGTRYANVINLEIADGPAVNIIGHGSELPFLDGTVDLVILQEVLEHIADFIPLLEEVRRILKPGGILFCQVPFQIGFHPGPKDYWRFTRQGLEHLFGAPHWIPKEIAISVGHGSGFYRIAVEFLAVSASCIWSRLYLPAKGAAALMLYPFKWFDLLTERSPERDRIPGGYYCIAEKLASPRH